MIYSTFNIEKSNSYIKKNSQKGSTYFFNSKGQWVNECVWGWCEVGTNHFGKFSKNHYILRKAPCLLRNIS